MAAEEDEAGSLQPPQHPVPHLQGPFEESMMESMIEVDDAEQKMDPIARRRMLLQGEKYERVCAGRWKQRPGERFHPLWKLSAQLSFGIHLLSRGLARSEEEVMRILQSHVDDVDGFLERTTEDFDLAQSDVDDRLQYLRLPLEHVDVFDRMLEDKAFRTSIVEGNEKIEHIVERTSEAMKDALKDVQKGIDATGALGKYLTSLKAVWMGRTPELEAVYTAMLGNVEGWTRAFMDLHLQGNRLTVSLVQLAGTIAEMQRRAGIASRKVLLPYTTAANGAPHTAGENGSQQKHQSRSPRSPKAASPQSTRTNGVPNKPLPLAPDPMTTARQASRTKLVQEEKLKMRSSQALRDLEKAKDTQTHAEGKASMADKVRSATKLGAHQRVVPPAQSPRIAERTSSARSPVLTKSRDRGSKKNLESQPRGPVELPAEVPRDDGGKQETPTKKGGLQIRLGSKHRHKERDSSHSPSKSLGLFRRSPQFPQSTENAMSSQSANAPMQTEAATESSTLVPAQQDTDVLLPPRSEPLPQRQSPDPGLPTPPALASTHVPHGGETRSYTALPEVLATAQRVKSAKASLRLSLPTSAVIEPEKTPRAIPSEPADSSPPKTLPLQPGSNGQSAQPGHEKHTEHRPSESSLGEPGPEMCSGHGTEAAENASVISQDEEKTPIASQHPQMQMPVASSSVSQNSSEDSADATLTSATMRSFSDFYKLPPQHSSPTTPPPATPDVSELPPHIAASVVTLSNHDSTTADDRETEPSQTPAEESKESEDARLSPSILSTKSPASHERDASKPKGLNLKAAGKDSSNQSGIFDVIVATPPRSPIHTRTSSDAETSTSRILAPPDQAPPPPAPGGRSMINPDYASAGALEGEKFSKRGSTISTNGWKKVFGGHGAGSPSGTTNPGNGEGPTSTSESQDENEEIQMSANLMSGKGNDVLWYKGMGKDGLWVSGA